MAGRPRKPTAQKKAQGTLRKYRENENEPEFSAITKVPKPPAGLNKHGKELWKTLITELSASGVITIPDLTAFEMLCSSFGRYKICQEYLEENLLKNIENDKGSMCAQARQMNAELAVCQKFMNQFGLTPADRNRLGLAKKKESDPDTEKMKGLLGA